MRAMLVPLDGSDPIELLKDLTLVGRKEDCDLRLDHKSVSKLHCVIVKSDCLLLVRDLGSTNSTRVNGQRIRRAALLANDQLTIANYKFRVHFGDEEAPVQPDEYTQQFDVDDVARLLQRARPAEEPEAEEEMDEGSLDGEPPRQPVQPNPLPDVYADDDPKNK